MKHSTDRILTTHCGSLARPKDLLDLMKAKVNGAPYDKNAYASRVQSAVAEIVRKQVENGIDVVTDGEQGKPGFFAYVRERLAGFEAKAPQAGGWKQWAAEVAAFPEYYENYFSRRMMGGSIAPRTPMGLVSYRGQEAIRKDIENLKAPLGGLKAEEAFMPAVAPSGVGTNEFYRSDEEFLRAVGEALREEYQAIVDAGFILQIDDPWLTEVHSQDPSLSFAERRKIAERSIDALNHPGGKDPLPHLLRHQRRSACARRTAERHRGPRFESERRRLRVRGRQRAARARISRLGNREAARRQSAHPWRDHPREQHRRAPRVDRRAHHALRQTCRPGKRDRRKRLRLFVSGNLQPRSPPKGRVGKVPSDGRRGSPGNEAALALSAADPTNACCLMSIAFF
jgi:methionine synthase II (cobalamin-independent)